MFKYLLEKLLPGRARRKRAESRRIKEFFGEMEQAVHQARLYNLAYLHELVKEKKGAN